MAKPIKVGDEFTYEAANYPNILIVSSDAAIISVDNTTRKISAAGTGIAFITIYDANNNNMLIDQFSLIVKENETAIGRLFGTGVERGQKVQRILTKLN